MKFDIKYLSARLESKVSYAGREFSFDTEPRVKEIDFTVILNSLNLSVCDRLITQIWGYAGDTNWIKTNLDIPNCNDGVLYVTDDFEYGFSYRINQSSIPVYHDEKTNWVCFGDPLNGSDGVKFMENCLALIDQNGELTSLWIKLLP